MTRWSQIAAGLSLVILGVGLGAMLRTAIAPAPDLGPGEARLADRAPSPPRRPDRPPPPSDGTPPEVAEPSMPAPVSPPQPTPSLVAPPPRSDAAGSGLRDLSMPVQGVEPAQLVDGFDEQRGGSRRHEAIDILAPRNTPVLAVADGRVAKLFESVPGGHTIYQFDSEERYCYYYAHLERYARGLKEGDPITRGQVIGYVGSSGNAPPDTPHLHFAIYRLGPDRRWWEGEPLDPFPLLRGVK